MLTQAVLPFKLEVTDETITPHAGLAIFGEFMHALGLPGALDRVLPWSGECGGVFTESVRHRMAKTGACRRLVCLPVEGPGPPPEDRPKRDEHFILEKAGNTSERGAETPLFFLDGRKARPGRGTRLNVYSGFRIGVEVSARDRRRIRESA